VSWETVVKFVLPAMAAILAWLANEWRRRAHEDYIRKEARYLELLRTLRGFYVSTPDRDSRQAFLDELARCWLYCPDEVIRKAYAFVDAVRVGASSSDVDKARTAGEFVLAIRRDLLGRRLLFLWRRTSLTHKDYQHLTVA
jgi:hypothetical protein